MGRIREALADAAEGAWFTVIGLGGLVLGTAFIASPMVGLYFLVGDGAEATLGAGLMAVFVLGLAGAAVGALVRR